MLRCLGRFGDFLGKFLEKLEAGGWGTPFRRRVALCGQLRTSTTF